MPLYRLSRNPRIQANPPATTTPQATVKNASVMPRYLMISATV